MVRRRAPPPCCGAPLNPDTRPLPATERGRRARAQIVTAAATLMYRRGVRATSLDDVLTAAGCGKSQLYHYFDGKADLVGAVIDQQLEFVLASQPALARIDSWATIDAWLAGILALQSQPGGPFACPLGTMAAELKNDESFRPRLDAAFRRWGSVLAAGLVRMQESGELAGDADPDRLAAAAVAALQGGMLLARVRADITPMRDAVDSVVAQLARWNTSAASDPPPADGRPK